MIGYFHRHISDALLRLEKELLCGLPFHRRQVAILG